jgi:arginine decarboxylase
MRLLPRLAVMTSGSGEGGTSLNAFDAALLNAGIGNLNLMRLSSVLPPNTSIHDLRDFKEGLALLPGQLVPVVYASWTDSTRGATISAAVAVIVPTVQDLNGMIFEASGLANEETIRDVAKQMAIESMLVRQSDWKEIRIESVSAVVEDRPTCVIAAVVFCDVEAA